jgi:hypothetical protein
MRFATVLSLASVLALGVLLSPQAGWTAQYRAEVVAEHRAQTWECGKGGYGVALCPSPRRKIAVPSAPPPAPPPEAEDECLKAGYGIPLCPSFGRRVPTPPSEAASAPPRKPQKDDCLKSGYGIPLCPSYGR